MPRPSKLQPGPATAKIDQAPTTTTSSSSLAALCMAVEHELPRWR